MVPDKGLKMVSRSPRKLRNYDSAAIGAHHHRTRQHALQITQPGRCDPKDLGVREGRGHFGSDDRRKLGVIIGSAHKSDITISDQESISDQRYADLA
ncbi:MAG: hypothetical protein EA402_00635 [Planctomycetota bacterium]|nr:MAG: hypothetical protein EA402_00635 [Planctomycetota bacterium]